MHTRYCKIKPNDWVFQDLQSYQWKNEDVVFQAKKHDIRLNELILVATDYGRLDIPNVDGNGHILAHEINVVDVDFKAKDEAKPI